MADRAKPQQTPGPWAIKVFAPCGPDMAGNQMLAHAVVIDRLECVVAFTWHKAGEVDHTPHPNATLIAAAPGMLDVLKGMVETIDSGFSPDFNEVDRARAVVAEATGVNP